MKNKKNVSLAVLIIFLVGIILNFTAIQNTTAEETEDRIVRVATTVWYENYSTKQQNLNKIYLDLADAAKSNPDIIVLSEGIYSDGSGPLFETVPGPFTNALAAKAIEHNTYIVANIYELDTSNNKRYNTNVLINKQGDIVGKYRKMRLPVNETQSPYNMTEGTEPMVFDTEFGKIATLICYDIDIRFPEVTKLHADLGAELILVSTWGDYTHAGVEFSRQNDTFMVVSGRGQSWADPYPVSSIIANDGTIINGVDRASNSSEVKTCFADINLTQKTWSVPVPKYPNSTPPPIRTSIPFTEITASDSLPGTNPQSLADGSIDYIDAGPDKGHPIWSSDKKEPTLIFDMGSLKKLGSVGIVQRYSFYEETYFKMFFSQDGVNYIEYTSGMNYATKNIKDNITGVLTPIKCYTAIKTPGYKYIEVNPPFDVRYIKIVGYGNSNTSYYPTPYTYTNLTEVTAFEPLNPLVTTAPFPTPTPTPPPTPTPILEIVTLNNSINLIGKVSNVDTPDTTILTDGIYSVGDQNQWTNNVTNSTIIVDFNDGADLKAFSVVGAQNNTQSLFYRLFITTDGTTWKEAGVDFQAAYTNKSSDGKYYANYANPGLVEGNQINENDLTFKTLQGTNCNIVQPIIFRYVQLGVKKVKVVLYGNSTTQWAVWNSVTEIDAYDSFVATTPEPVPTSTPTLTPTPTPTSAPTPISTPTPAQTQDRIIRVATTGWVNGSGTKAQNLQNIYTNLADAAKSNPDIIVLTEGNYSLNNWSPFFETVPGPFTDAISTKAIEHNTYIVANMFEYDASDNKKYNTNVLINKQGEIVGKYRKMRLPPSETTGAYGMTEGTEPMVFDTEFGKIATLICYDIDSRFPEVTQEHVDLGAELILVTSLGDYTYGAVEFARRSNVFMVVAARDNYWNNSYPVSSIIANDGTVINGINQPTGSNPKSAYADINLSDKTWSVLDRKHPIVAPPPIRTSIPFTNITASHSLAGRSPETLNDGYIDNIDAGPMKGRKGWSSDTKEPTLIFDMGGLKKVGSVGIAQYDIFYQEAYFKMYFSQDGINYIEYTKGLNYATKTLRDNVTGSSISVQCYTATMTPGYKYIEVNPPFDIRYIKIVGYGNSTSSYKSTNLTEVTAFEPLNLLTTSAPFPTPTPVPTPTPTPIGEIVILNNPINLVGKVSNIDTPDTTILTDGIYSQDAGNQWTNNVTNSQIIVNFNDGADLKAFSVVGAQNSTQSLFYRLFITKDGATWEEAGVDFQAAYTNMHSSGNYYANYEISSLVEGNKINEDHLTFKTQQGINAVQPVIFKDVQVGVKKVKVVLYGNSTTQWSVWNSVTEINAYDSYTVITPEPTATSIPTPTATPTPIATPTSTPTPIATSTPTPTLTATSMPTPTVTSTPTATVEPTPAYEFTDIEENHWAFEQIYSLTAIGIIAGYDNGDGTYSYKPDNFIKRLEFIKILTLAFGVYDPESIYDEFTDVTKEDWYYSYVASAVNEGLTVGISEDAFGSDQEMTRQDLVTFIERALVKYMGYVIPNEEEINISLSMFVDHDEVSAYARPALALLVENNVISGFVESDNTYFKPKNKATRAEVSIITDKSIKLEDLN